MASNRRTQIQNKFLTTQRKAAKENKNEAIEEARINKAAEDIENLVKNKATKVSASNLLRLERQKIPTNVIKWFENNGHKDLIEPYKKWSKSQAKYKNKMASLLAKKFGFSIEKEHWVPISGADEDILEPKKPYTSISKRGADSEGGSGSGRWNRRIGGKRAFVAETLQLLNQPINWSESAANFVAKRPDLKSDLNNRVKNLDFIRLQQGLVTGDELELELFSRADLQNSGIKVQDSAEYFKDFENLLTDINNKDLVKSAQDNKNKAPFDIGLKRRLNPNEQRAKLFKFPPLPNKKVLASAAYTVMETGRKISAATLDPRDLADPLVWGNVGQAQDRIESGENTWQVLKEEGTDIAKGFKDQLLTTGGFLTGAKIASKFAPGVVAGGSTAFGYVAPPLLAVGIWKSIDAYQAARGKRTLSEVTIEDFAPLYNAAKEGEKLTTVKGDDTLGESMLSREQGTGAVWDEENKKWQVHTIPRI